MTLETTNHVNPVGRVRSVELLSDEWRPLGDTYPAFVCVTPLKLHSGRLLQGSGKPNAKNGDPRIELMHSASECPVRGLLLNQVFVLGGPATGYDARATQVSEYCGKPLEEPARESGARGCPDSCLARPVRLGDWAARSSATRSGI